MAYRLASELELAYQLPLALVYRSPLASAMAVMLESELEPESKAL